MKRLLICLSALLLSLPLPSASSLKCPTSRRSFTDYSRRENNRCEGKTRSGIGSGAIRLIALSTKPINRFGSNLTLKVPHRGPRPPAVTLRSVNDSYLLNQLRLIRREITHNAFFSTRVLTESGVTPNELRCSARYGNHYVPIQIGGKHSRYEIVLEADSPTRITTFQIRRNNIVQYRTRGSSSARPGEIKFFWDGKRNGATAPAGTYESYYGATVERRGLPRESKTDTIPFSHNPQWLN